MYCDLDLNPFQYLDNERLERFIVVLEQPLMCKRRSCGRWWKYPAGSSPLRTEVARDALMTLVPSDGARRPAHGFGYANVHE